MIYIGENNATFIGSTGTDTFFTPGIIQGDQMFTPALFQDNAIFSISFPFSKCYAIDTLLRKAIDTQGRYAVTFAVDSEIFSPEMVKDDPLNQAIKKL